MAGSAGGMDRRGFIARVSVIGASALLTRCGGDPSSVALPVTNGSVTLTFTEFPVLAQPGGGVVVQVQGGSPILVVRHETGAVAMTAVCTHEGCTVGFDPTTLGAACPCHGSQYDSEGHVTRGPAPLPLELFAATLEAEGIKVTIG